MRLTVVTPLAIIVDAEQRADEQAARTDAERLYLAAIRQIYRFLRPGSSGIAGRFAAPNAGRLGG